MTREGDMTGPGVVKLNRRSKHPTHRGRAPPAPYLSRHTTTVTTKTITTTTFRLEGAINTQLHKSLMDHYRADEY